MSSRYERTPYLVAYQNNSGVRDVYGGLAEIVVLECYLLKPDVPSDTVVVFMLSLIHISEPTRPY